MSSHLLQKSLKLFEETDEYKKKRKRGLCFNFTAFFFLSSFNLQIDISGAKRIKKEQVKKRKQLKGIQSVNEQVSNDEILKKIQQLEKLNANIPAAVSEKVCDLNLMIKNDVIYDVIYDLLIYLLAVFSKDKVTRKDYNRAKERRKYSVY